MVHCPTNKFGDTFFAWVNITCKDLVMYIKKIKERKAGFLRNKEPEEVAGCADI